MDQDQFVAAMRSLGVHTARDIVKELREGTPARESELNEISSWFGALPPQQRERIEKIVDYSIWSFTFHLFCQFDGVAGEPKEGKYELRYVKGRKKTLLNSEFDPELDYLHDLFVAEFPHPFPVAMPIRSSKAAESKVESRWSHLLDPPEPTFMEPWNPVRGVVESLPECDPELEEVPFLKTFKTKLRKNKYVTGLLEDIWGLVPMLIASRRFPEAIRIAEAIETVASVPLTCKESAHTLWPTKWFEGNRSSRSLRGPARGPTRDRAITGVQMGNDAGWPAIADSQERFGWGTTSGLSVPKDIELGYRKLFGATRL